MAPRHLPGFAEPFVGREHEIAIRVNRNLWPATAHSSLGGSHP